MMLIIPSVDKFEYNISIIFFQVCLKKGEDRMYIFRTWTTTKDGKRIYARDYGKRAFRIKL